VIDIERLYRTHCPRVRKAVAGGVGGVGPELIEDACQDAWLAAFRNRDRLHADRPEAVYGYVVKTAIRRAWKLAAGRQRMAELELDLPDGLDLEARVIAHDALQLSGASERQRRMLWLKALGLSHAEVADATGSSVRAVDRQLRRGRRALTA
jgi:DNA-directed RNA polymerase specialized sigma24 family protein